MFKQILKRGQGSFEYILLLAGVLLIVVLAVVLLRGQSSTSGESSEWQQCKAGLVSNQRCYDTAGKWLTTSEVPLNTLPACLAIKDTVLKTVSTCTGLDKEKRTSVSIGGVITDTACCGLSTS